MSVYNAKEFIDASISSIINQTFNDLEFIIVNDGSTDNSLEIIKSYDDNRIKILNNNTNQGLTKSLNIGLRHCSGKYIARMDADDFSMSSRIQMQYQFLESNPDIDIIGTNVYMIINKERYKIDLPLDDERIKWQLLFSSPIIHPSVMIRSEIFKKYGNYNPKLKVAQDFEYWCKVSQFVKFANLPDILHNVRIHPASVSNVKNVEQEYSRLKTLAKFVYSITKKRYALDDLNTFYLMRSKKFLTYEQLKIAIEILNRLQQEYFKRYNKDISFKNFVNQKISWIILQPVFSHDTNYHLLLRCLLAAFKFNHSIIREKIFFTYIKVAIPKAIQQLSNAYMFRR